MQEHGSLILLLENAQILTFESGSITSHDCVLQLINKIKQKIGMLTFRKLIEKIMDLLEIKENIEIPPQKNEILDFWEFCKKMKDASWGPKNGPPEALLEPELIPRI